MYRITRVPTINVPAGEIALVVAKDGKAPKPGRVLCDYVDCDDFQDGRAFLVNGGQKGRQLRVLHAGEHRINTELFDVILSGDESTELPYSCFRSQRINADQIGIVTIFDGQSLPRGEIAAPFVDGHDNFQDAQAFIDAGGMKGLQQEYLPSGEYFLNPWFVGIEKVPLVEIAPGAVAVVTSHVGMVDPEATTETLVDEGFKGIRRKPLLPGTHAINTKTHTLQPVPVHDITLNWSGKEKPEGNYDADLGPLRLMSSDGFEFKIEVTQVLKIAEDDAPKLISKIGPTQGYSLNEISIIGSRDRFLSIRNLVNRVLEPMVNNHFRHEAQKYRVMEFHSNRSELQQEAAQTIRDALKSYGVQATGTFINEIELPKQLQEALQEQKIEEERAKIIQIQQVTARERLELEKRNTQARMAAELERHEYDVRISALKSKIWQVEDQREIDKLKSMIEAIGGQEAFAELEKIKEMVKIRLPEVFVGGGQTGQDNTGFGTLDLFFFKYLRENKKAPSAKEFFDFAETEKIEDRDLALLRGDEGSATSAARPAINNETGSERG